MLSHFVAGPPGTEKKTGAVVVVDVVVVFGDDGDAVRVFARP